MNKIYTLNEAREFAKEFENIQNLGEIDYLKLGKTIKMLAEKNEETSFKKLINKYLELSEAYNMGIFDKDIHGKINVNQKNYSFLEFMCLSMDNSYTTDLLNHLVKRIMKEGNLKKMFKQNYSSFKEFEDLDELK